MPCFQFDSTTQFIWAGDWIVLRQGTVDIAKGYLADWLSLFQYFSSFKENETQIQIFERLAGTWDVDHQSVIIQSPNQMGDTLRLIPQELQQLEVSLLDLHQGCCGPVSYNFVADINQDPDGILGLLQDITSFKLSDSQFQVAKASIVELPTEFEIDILDLYNLWEDNPDLSYFAKALQFYFLSA